MYIIFIILENFYVICVTEQIELAYIREILLVSTDAAVML